VAERTVEAALATPVAELYGSGPGVLPADLALLIRVVLNLQGSVAGWARRCG
jgi:hypothetical protein